MEQSDSFSELELYAELRRWYTNARMPGGSDNLLSVCAAQEGSGDARLKY